MKKLLYLVSLLLLATLAFGQCLPPVNQLTKLPANWPSGAVFNPAAPVDPPAYFSCANYALSPLPLRSCSDTGATACYGDLECAGLPDATTPTQPAVCSGPIVSGGIHKFVDALPGVPGVTPIGANLLGQSIPLAVADKTKYPGTDYYEIELGEYSQKMHTDLPATKLRGYRQTNGPLGVSAPFQYLGPLIIAQKNVPVRVKFTNKLPVGAGGNLFLPVDTTYMGAGSANGTMPADPQRPECGTNPKPTSCYTENRATLHLHGGITPWISDGTAHQWITPLGQITNYPQGVSVQNVPDMADANCGAAGDGCQTFYYTNQQSARMLFYHDHAWGITRLNVYAGEAAGYLIQDPTELNLIAGGLIPAVQIPLVIQDKTFVPTSKELALWDPLWDQTRWGGMGSLWQPHVYQPAQNPGDSSGVNAFGRWMYGPWFWPPTNDITNPPMANPYYDSACNPSLGWCEPPLMPATPYLSSGMEAFNDTPMVNGTVYPTVTLAPQAYRFRILNAANDRVFNLQWYVADPASGGKEVALNALEVAAAQTDPVIAPTPDTSISPKGPAWMVIGTEGGFLPAPAVVLNQPVTYVTDPTRFDVGNVDLHSLLAAPAERFDVIVDFTPFAGKTLILYNDAPAAFPARVANYDYYLGHPDMTDTGGAPTTLPGYGPNTRTIMQVVITGPAGAATPDYYNAATLTALQTAFAHHLDATTGQPAGVFESSQHPIIVGQGAYNTAYGTNFNTAAPADAVNSKDGFARIHDFSLMFDTLSGAPITMPLQNKAIHDEMGGTFDPDYGRMTGTLGVEVPNAKAFLQAFVNFPFTSPPTELINTTGLPKDFAITNLAGQPFAGNELKVTPITTLADGTQIWKITHNGVDTHPIHFHLYDVQLLNRSPWDGTNILAPDATELGWKDTVRVSPLQDTFVALRPIVPVVPFDLPNSVRLLNPAMPDGALLASATLADAFVTGNIPMDPNGEPIDLYNHLVNFGYEYVWHCHILGHEEMDMMRSAAVGVPPIAPTGLAVTTSGNKATLTWADKSLNETGFTIIRATDGGFVTGLTTIPLGPNTTTYVDTIKNNTTYYYKVIANNVVGDTWDYTNPNLNNGASFPSIDVTSTASATVQVGAVTTVPAAPTNFAAALQAGPQVRLTWRDNSNNETGFVVKRQINAGAVADLVTLPSNTSSYVDTAVASPNGYTYQVCAVNSGGTTCSSNTNTVNLLAVPAAPTGVSDIVTNLKNSSATVTVAWNGANVTNETGFRVKRASDVAFTLNLATYNVGIDAATFSQSVSRTAADQLFYYCVQSINANGASPCVLALPSPTTIPAR